MGNYLSSSPFQANQALSLEVHPFEAPFVLDIEGLIGVGKTSLIEECLIPILMEKGWRVTLITEPVGNWNEILPRFYQDPKRWGYHFQTKAFHDRVKESLKMWKRHKEHTDIFICERGVMSDVLFMESLHDQGHVDDLEWKHYMEWWVLWEEIMPFRPDMFVYLVPSMDETMRRVRLRNRNGEEGVSRDYQEHLKIKHDKMFGGGYAKLSDNHYVPVYRLETDSDFKNDKEIKRKLVDELEHQIVKIYKNRVKH